MFIDMDDKSEKKSAFILTLFKTVNHVLDWRTATQRTVNVFMF